MRGFDRRHDSDDAAGGKRTDDSLGRQEGTERGASNVASFAQQGGLSSLDGRRWKQWLR